MSRVDLSLRQAILSDDVALVRRILNNNPSRLQNPDFSDKSNTSLHLAAQHGLEEIGELLIAQGHDGSSPVEGWIFCNQVNNQGISVNTEGRTPLHLAAAHSQADMVELLCKEFPRTVTRRDKKGQTPLHLAAASQVAAKATNMSGSAYRPAAHSPQDNRTIEILLARGADVKAKDEVGNTCLHNASAWGNLKAIRALIQAGADPLSKNNAGWTPEFYSITVQAEVYYRNLVAEWEKRRAEDEMRASERRAKGGGAVRLVPQEKVSHEGSEARTDRSRGDSLRAGENDAGLGISVEYVDAWK